MATKLDRKFARTAIENVETLVNEVERLECYCSALEKKLSPQQINDASAEGAREWKEMGDV